MESNILDTLSTSIALNAAGFKLLNDTIGTKLDSINKGIKDNSKQLTLSNIIGGINAYQNYKQRQLS